MTVAAVPDAAGAAQPNAAGGASLVVEGAGEGHGVGLSQDGAYGYAKHGWTFQQILAHYYSGSELGQAPANSVVRVLVGKQVKRIPLERYVRGVVGAEVSPSWPAAALEAQAIASRTYALTDHAGGKRFDVYADTRSQVFRGAAAESAATNAAVAATEGQIVTYEGQPVITYFFASSGGMTENVQYGFLGATPEPWLRSVVDSYNAGSTFSWTTVFTMPAASRALKGLFTGSFRGIEVLERGVSPRIVSARVLGSTSSTVVDGARLAARLGLSSTWAYFSIRAANGATKPEPDHSGQHRGTVPTAPSSPSPPPAPPAQVGKQGGVPANASESSTSPSVEKTGGVQAPD